MTDDVKPQSLRRLVYIAKYGSEAAADARLAEEARQDAICAAESRKLVDLDALLTPRQVSKAPAPIRPLRGGRSSGILETKRPGGPVDWDMWRRMPTAMLWEAVALSLNSDPGDQIPPDAAYFPADYPKRLRIAEAHLSAKPVGKLRLVDGLMGTPGATVSLPEFGAWAVSLGWTLPAEFPRATPEPTQDASPKPSTQGPAGWPWGAHGTKLLGHLDAAARHWWVNFDPLDNTTAPTNQEVSAWLHARGVGKAMADKMATILRADGLPTGPRT